MSFFRKTVRPRASRRRFVPPVRLALECLESRVTPYVASGNAWPVPQLVTISFEPDGTVLGQSFNGPVTSNLFANFNQRFGSPSVWQNAILKAAQAWAQQTNINFALVADNGTMSGGGSYQQGDPGMGDIRISGYAFNNSSLAGTEMPPPINNYSGAGDIYFNTTYGFVIGTSGGFNLQTTAEHEFGHALGLDHTNVGGSAIVMNPYYTGYKINLNADDIAGVRNIYSNNNPRSADVNDAVASNDSFSTATNITSQIDTGSLTALATGLDITTTSDLDYYTFTAPAGSASSLTLKVQSSGLSLLSPKVTVYAADQVTVLGTTNGAGQYGTTLSVTVNGITAGQQFYVKVQGADSTAMSTGAYALTLNLGTGPSPTVPLPNTQTLNGASLSMGGGSALSTGGHGRGHQDKDDRLENGAVGDRLSVAETPSISPAADVAMPLLAQVVVQADVTTSVLAQRVVFGPVTPVSLTRATVAPVSPGLRVFVESGGDTGTPDTALPSSPAIPAPEVPAPVPAPLESPAPNREAPSLSVGSLQAYDACFADPEQVAHLSESEAAAALSEAGPTAAALDPALASAALIVVLGGYWGGSEERERFRRVNARF